jgi:hypothetical protein
MKYLVIGWSVVCIGIIAVWLHSMALAQTVPREEVG